jgi:hypothetical protein
VKATIPARDARHILFVTGNAESPAGASGQTAGLDPFDRAFAVSGISACG